MNATRLTVDAIVPNMSARYVSLNSCVLTIQDALAEYDYIIGSPKVVDDNHKQGVTDISVFDGYDGDVATVRILWDRSYGYTACTIVVK